MPLCSEEASFLKENKKESIVLKVWVLVFLSLCSTTLYTQKQRLLNIFLSWRSRQIICILRREIHTKTSINHISLWFSLQDFKLDFGNFQGKTSERWHGGIATIFQSPGDEVWGVVWKMNKSNLSSLDE